MNGKNSVFVFFIIFLSILNIHASAEHFIKDDTFSAMPVIDHLHFAEFKLKSDIKKAENSGKDSIKLNKLKEASGHLLESIRKYEYYRTRDSKFLQEDWLENYIWVASKNAPPVTESPLSHLNHLRIAYEESLQIKASIMVAAVQYSDSDLQLIDSLNESVDIMKKVIVLIEESRGWVKHDNPKYRMLISVPPEFKKNSAEKTSPIDLVKYKSDGSPDKAVIVNFQSKQEELSPEELVNQKIEKLRKKFPDMSDVKRLQIKGYSRDLRALFSYKYTWEGETIKGLAFLRKVGDRLYDVKCLAVEDAFDEEEFMEIIRSFRH